MATTARASPSRRCASSPCIAQRFNTLAEALEKARAENSRLYRNFIAVQEDERRQVANELHDEAGPCLFGITANVSSIERLAGQAPEAQGAAIKTRAAGNSDDRRSAEDHKSRPAAPACGPSSWGASPSRS